MCHRVIRQLFVIPASLGASLCWAVPYDTPLPESDYSVVPSVRVEEEENRNPALPESGLSVIAAATSTAQLEQLRDTGKQQAAEAAYKLALQFVNNNNKGTAIELIREAAFLQPDNARYIHLASRLAFELKDYPATETYLFRLLAIYRSQATPDALKEITLFDELVTLYVAWGQKDAARSALMKGLVIKKATFGEDHPYIIDDIYRLAELELNAGNVGESKRQLERAFALLENSSAAIDDRDVATAFHNIGELYRVSGQWTDAERAYLKALTFWNKAPMMNQQEIQTTARRLAQTRAMQSASVTDTPLSTGQGRKMLTVEPRQPAELPEKM
ncbi:tetratricopeptide repeat protein [Sedimenticola thiotaurini]|uniref:tetratricopeptide repeat protein n=1 Tax=Sedimenticola thiotaurini TaxID=1543721 RepID=UPI0018FFCDA7|nr:tetratricopeptide repeat protein [Sedimenticola thiotaurini]